jgi:hypothetical protein
MSESKSSSGGIGFCGLLTIVFITLKLCQVIDWSWWWVLCPVWIALALACLVIGVAYLWSYVATRFFSTPIQKEYMRRIQEENKKNAGKSKWQIRMEQMQEAQKKRTDQDNYPASPKPIK